MTALAIPTYLLFSRFSLTDTPWAVIVPSLVSPFGVYLMRVYADGAVPESILEAARVDGAGELRIFFTVALRLLAPGFVTVLLFQLVATWNNYFLPLIMLNSSKWFPLTVGLAQWQATSAARVRLPGAVLHGDHRLHGLDHPAGRRVPLPAAVLAVGAGHGRGQAVTRKDDDVNDLPRPVLFGAAYYHEYQPRPGSRRTSTSWRRPASRSSAWGSPPGRRGSRRTGVFDLDWLQPVLDGAHARGISVVLGTPTYAVPPWLVRKYPEIAGERGTGRPIPWGARQEVDYTHAAFLFHAERVIRAVVGRYADHPAVIGFQVDNEPGLRAVPQPRRLPAVRRRACATPTATSRR